MRSSGLHTWIVSEGEREKIDGVGEEFNIAIGIIIVVNNIKYIDKPYSNLEFLTTDDSTHVGLYVLNKKDIGGRCIRTTRPCGYGIGGEDDGYSPRTTEHSDSRDSGDFTAKILLHQH